jgi:hypothetical protein
LAQPPDEDDAVLKLAEPDFTLMGMQTSLRLPVNRSAFRVTHRFGRSLGEGDFGDLLDDLFGLDNGAVIGLEFRYGLLPGAQVGIHRSSLDKIIEFFGQYGITRQTDTMPLEISAVASVEGIDNFRDQYSPAIGVILTRLVGDRAALHVEPIIVGSTNITPEGDDDGTFLIGLGGRLRLRPSVYIVGEFVPRVSGDKPGVNHGSFAIEKRAGGHLFQLNFSNSFATTHGQLARGGFSGDNWYMGFNISRKFF